MATYQHEVRDPIHVFIGYDPEERRVIDSQPFQRLRHIHQLALTYLVYPGATHRRFEHSLGVMELASRVYDVVTDQKNVAFDSVRDVIPKPESFELRYWRRALRMASLCHDIGHLPFSHAAEEDLLPDGWDHERLTEELILSDLLRPIWSDIKVQAEDIAKLAVKPRGSGSRLDPWSALLSEIIIGDEFGVDRMDYLLRDSHHVGVAYGRFDHYRLIDSLRILPKAEGGSQEPVLGVDQGGLQSAEAMLLARYFMFAQVYCHPVRRIYDIHLKDFLRDILPNGRFSTDLRKHLGVNDNEVLSRIATASETTTDPGHEPARRVAHRDHFKLVYERNPTHITLTPNSPDLIHARLCERYDEESVRFDHYPQGGREPNFPVLMRNGNLELARSMSPTLDRLPVVSIDYVFVAPHHRDDAIAWLRANADEIIREDSEG